MSDENNESDISHLHEMMDRMGEDPPPPDRLELLNRAAASLKELDDRISRGERLLAELKTERYRRQTVDMLELMDSCRTSSITVEGVTFDVEQTYKASIPKSSSDEALDWLERNEAGDLIDYDVIVSFPKNCQDEAARLEDYVRKNYQIAAVEKKRAVPWARLTSWFKDYLRRSDQRQAEGLSPLPELPTKILGATAERAVKIERPKKSR